MTRCEPNLQNVKTLETPQQEPQPEFMDSKICSQLFIALTLINSSGQVDLKAPPRKQEFMSITDELWGIKPNPFYQPLFSLWKNGDENNTPCHREGR